MRRLLLTLLAALAGVSVAAPAAAQNPYNFVVAPPSGATAGASVSLAAQAPPGQTPPPGLHCVYQAISFTLPAITEFSPQCGPVQVHLAAGAWRLRLIVHRGTNPRALPTQAETVSVQEVSSYRVGGCAAQCETVAGACVKPRGDVMPCVNGRCPPGYACTSGFCRQVPVATGPVIACAANNNCPPGWTCSNHQCRAPAPAELAFSCRDNTDCGQGWICTAAKECRRTCP
jgi:hypothetical protein